jgi:hypothetical protein
MLKDKYCIMSFPELQKHYVLRVADNETCDIVIDICGLKLTASMNSITDSYDEAVVVYNNIKG